MHLMHLKRTRSLSKFLGLWAFFLLLIFKGVFPKPAFAFISSLDACAARPECASAISSELAPSIAAPTAEGVASTITATTTAGVSTTTQVAAGVTVVGDIRLSGIVAYHLWKQAQNGQAQEKAKERYCAAYPNDEVCGSPSGQSLTNYWVKAEAVVDYRKFLGQYHDPQYADPIRVSFTYDSTVSGGSLYGPIYGIQPELVTGKSFGGSFSGFSFMVLGSRDSRGFYQSIGLSPVTSSQQLSWNDYSYNTIISNRITEITRVDGQPDDNQPPLPWKDWSQEKRSTAVALLTESDWLEFVKEMPVGGVLNPGDKVEAPGGVVIPGELENDPNTPEDERLPRKEPSFTSPPDFDYDREPDEFDTDDDDDGTPDSSDPDPQNPLVPKASSDPSNPSPEPPSEPAPNPSSTPEPGVGGNGTASEFGDMTGMSRADVDAFLRSLEATVKTTAGGYTQYKFPDKSEVWIRPSPDNEVVRTPAPTYGSDGSRTNKGARLDQNGNLTDPPVHNTGERLRD